MDLAANAMTSNIASLSVEDKITDPLMMELDPSLLDFGPMNPLNNMEVGRTEQIQVDWANWSSSQVFPGSGLKKAPEQPRDDLDMDVELDLDLGDDDEPSIEIGRKDTAPVRGVEEDLINDDDKFQGNGFMEDEPLTEIPDNFPLSTVEEDENMDMMLMDDPMEDVTIPVIDDLSTAAPPVTALPELDRDSESPLSSARSSVVRTFDETRLSDLQEQEEESDISIHRQHKAKKRKILPVDVDTVMSQAQIKQMQADRSAILKPLELLSPNPLLLNLLRMQQDGSFVTDIMADGRSKNWAPELRGILSLAKIDAARTSWESKRKADRNATNARAKNMDAETPQPDGPRADTPRNYTPQLQIPEDDEEIVRYDEDDQHFDREVGRFDAAHANGDDTVMHEQLRPLDQESLIDNFDETVAPLLYPTEQGSVSQGTRHAVHILRERFGSSDQSTQGSSSSQKPHLRFQDLCAEATTTKADAARMFFEVLVLATKDAIKVEQAEGPSGAPMKIRAKRGLWGAWAEYEEQREENEEAAAEVEVGES